MSCGFPVLVTDRLALREITEDDFAAIHAYGSDPEVVQYVPWGPNTEEDTHDFIARALLQAVAEPRLEFVFAVERRGEEGPMLGTVGLYLRAHDQDQAMLGYVFSRDAWGRGIATEAAGAILEMGFEVLGLRRIWAACDPDNAASVRVLEKAGFTMEGRLRDDSVIRGEVRDTLLWAILEREWRDAETTRAAPTTDSTERSR